MRALTGVDTDRLPEEKARGLSIVLGYAPLRLPSGRMVSLIDVPGHERLIRTMVSGATGVDLLLLAVAADDGVMPQTLEHVRVLEALGVSRGVLAITKCDLADPEPAARASAELLPGLEVVACSARTGHGVIDVAAALDRAAAGTQSRATLGRAVVLHIDRVFTIRGAGTVVTGTLWSGTIRAGDRLLIEPGDRPARVRGIQVHDQPVQEAAAGQRVAVNLAGVNRRAVEPGEALVGKDASLRTAYSIEAELSLHEALEDGARVQVHHGTRSAAARARRRGGGWNLRLERPLLAAPGDRLVVRRVSPAETLGGGVVLQVGRRRSPPAGSVPRPNTQPPALTAEALVLEERLRAAGHEPPSEAELGEMTQHLPALHAAGRAVRVGRSMHAHPSCIATVRAAVETIIRSDGAITLARLRDELGTSRRYAQALLEHLDAARVTRRREDDTRVLRRNER